MNYLQRHWNVRETMIVITTACVLMVIIESVLQPTYAVKSATKLLLFLGSIFIYERICSRKILSMDFNKKALWRIGILAIGSYLLILGGYFLIQDYLDIEQIKASLMGKEGIDRGNFLFVAIYISVVNSFVEELFFRGFAFQELYKMGYHKVAYLFSAGAFAIYHVGIISGWFSVPVFVLMIAGLFAAGMVLNLFCRYADSIFGSWIIHASANLAINTIGFMIL